MLETYFVKPQTAGRIRACWIGAEIERYAGWLSEQGYSTRTVLHRVPVLVAFGGFARRRGGNQSGHEAHRRQRPQLVSRPIARSHCCRKGQK